MKRITTLLSSVAFLALAGCGGGGSDEPGIAELPSGASCEYDATAQTETGVQWDKLINTFENNLSAYKLFQDNADPTQNPQERGLAYDMSTPLFTDYASKYRFVFVPPGCAAEYTSDEIFDFPIGTTLVKSFAMPANTANRGIENEDLIETRLLIKRAVGWIAIPYVWNAEGTDATRQIIAKTVIKDLTHNESDFTFDYKVPSAQDCVTCHSLEGVDDTSSKNIAIGPKARYLNSDYVYSDGTTNQLTKWKEKQLLSGLPNLASVDAVPEINDSSDIGAMSNAELQIAAKAYLDINCAHCHRSTPSGEASNTNMHVEWGRDYDTKAHDNGECATPISFGGSGAGEYIIEPGNAARSLMVFRMQAQPGQETTDSGKGDQMPRLGRSLVHTEGVALISAWINSMPASDSCNL